MPRKHHNQPLRKQFALFWEGKRKEARATGFPRRFPGTGAPPSQAKDHSSAPRGAPNAKKTPQPISPQAIRLVLERQTKESARHRFFKEVSGHHPIASQAKEHSSAPWGAPNKQKTAKLSIPCAIRFDLEGKAKGSARDAFSNAKFRTPAPPKPSQGPLQRSLGSPK